jgi:hypothetical protein
LFRGELRVKLRYTGNDVIEEYLHRDSYGNCKAIFLIVRKGLQICASAL